MTQNLSLAHCKSKTILILEIKDLVFKLRTIKQRAFTHPVYALNISKSSQG